MTRPRDSVTTVMWSIMLLTSPVASASHEISGTRHLRYHQASHFMWWMTLGGLI